MPATSWADASSDVLLNAPVVDAVGSGSGLGIPVHRDRGEIQPHAVHVDDCVWSSDASDDAMLSVTNSSDESSDVLDVWVDKSGVEYLWDNSDDVVSVDDVGPELMLTIESIIRFLALWAAVFPQKLSANWAVCMPVSSDSEVNGGERGEATSARRCKAEEAAVCALSESEGGRVTLKMARDIAIRWQCSRNHRRKNVRDDGDSFVYSDAVGLVTSPNLNAFPERVCMTTNARSYPAVVRLLNLFLRSQLDDMLLCPNYDEETKKNAAAFRWTTITINQDVKCKRHRDRNNVGLSAIIALGNFKKGQLNWWPNDSRSGPVMSLDDSESCKLNVKDRVRFFDGRNAHETCEFRGVRTSVIWFATTIPDGLTEELKEEAEYLEFSLPDLPTIVAEAAPLTEVVDGQTQDDGDAVRPSQVSVAAAAIRDQHCDIKTAVKFAERVECWECDLSESLNVNKQNKKVISLALKPDRTDQRPHALRRTHVERWCSARVPRGLAKNQVAEPQNGQALFRSAVMALYRAAVLAQHLDLCEDCELLSIRPSNGGEAPDFEVTKSFFRQVSGGNGEKTLMTANGVKVVSSNVNKTKGCLKDSYQFFLEMKNCRKERGNRSRQFGWPAVIEHDGSLHVYVAPDYNHVSFTEDHDKDWWSTAYVPIRKWVNGEVDANVKRDNWDVMFLVAPPIASSIDYGPVFWHHTYAYQTKRLQYQEPPSCDRCGEILGRVSTDMDTGIVIEQKKVDCATWDRKRAERLISHVHLKCGRGVTSNVLNLRTMCVYKLNRPKVEHKAWEKWSPGRGHGDLGMELLAEQVAAYMQVLYDEKDMRTSNNHSEPNACHDDHRPWSAALGPEFVMTAGECMPDWIVDTGAAHHLQQLNTADVVRAALKPKRVRSANGSFTMTQEALTDIPSLGINGQGLVTSLWESTPNALSVGRLVMNGGCSFMWPARQRPHLMLADGTTVFLQIRKYVPFLPHQSIDPGDIVHPDEVQVDSCLVGEAVDDGWGSGDSDTIDDRECDVPPWPMQKMPEGFQLPPVTKKKIVKPSSDVDPDLPFPYDYWSNAEWDKDVDEEDGACVPCARAPMLTVDDWKSEAVSTEHLMRHGKANKYCWVCRQEKSRHRRHVTKLEPTWAKLSEFGQVVTLDHFDCVAEHKNSVDGHKHGLVMLDLHSGFLCSRPVMSKSAAETALVLRAWRGRTRILHVHSDGAGELDRACAYEGITTSVSETGDHQGNGIAEAHVKLSKLGAATALTQAGLPREYWNYALLHFEVAWNSSQDTGRGYGSSWEARFSEPFPGLLIPFGAEVWFKPPPEHRYARAMHPIGPNSIQGVFFGYDLSAGCRATGMYWVVALADFDTVSLREDSTDGKRVRPTRARTIVSPKPGEKLTWKFPLVAKYKEKNQSALGRDLTESVPGHREEVIADVPPRESGGSSSSSYVGPLPLPPPSKPPSSGDRCEEEGEARRPDAPSDSADVVKDDSGEDDVLGGHDPAILGKLTVDSEWPFAITKGKQTQRPMEIPTAVWSNTMGPPARLDCLNEIRRGLGLRVAPTLTIMKKYMDEEYGLLTELRTKSRLDGKPIPMGEALAQIAIVESEDVSVSSSRDDSSAYTMAMVAQNQWVPTSRDVKIASMTIVPAQKSTDQRHVLWVRRVHPHAKLPCRGTDGSAGFDLFACGAGCIPPNGMLKVNLGIQIALPAGTFGHILSKSSVASSGVNVGAGVIDNDYRGDVQVLLKNGGTEDWSFQGGQKVAQLVVKRYLVPVIKEATQLSDTARGDGGFGSTGTGLAAVALRSYNCPTWGATRVDLADDAVTDCIQQPCEHVMIAQDDVETLCAPLAELQEKLISAVIRGRGGHLTVVSDRYATHHRVPCALDSPDWDAVTEVRTIVPNKGEPGYKCIRCARIVPASQERTLLDRRQDGQNPKARDAYVAVSSADWDVVAVENDELVWFIDPVDAPAVIGTCVGEAMAKPYAASRPATGGHVGADYSCTVTKKSAAWGGHRARLQKEGLSSQGQACCYRIGIHREQRGKTESRVHSFLKPHQGLTTDRLVW